MQKQKVILAGICIVLALVLFAVLGIRSMSVPDEVSSPVGGEFKNPLEVTPSGDTTVSTRQPDEIVEVQQPEVLVPDEELERLQEFLDANDNEAIVEQAAFLIVSEEPQRREEAIDALMWVSTPQAGMVLLSALQHPDERTSHQALSALTHILDTLATQIVEDSESGELLASDENGLSEEALAQSFDLWLAACKSVSDVEALESLLIPLSGMEVKFSVPILVELTESLSGARRDKAAEYLDIATNSEGVVTREDALLWLQQHSEDE